MRKKSKQATENTNTATGKTTKSKQLSFEKARGSVFRPLSNDLLFHVVLQKNLTALKGLISSLLSLKREDIKEIELLNPIDFGQNVSDKEIILDSRILLNNDKEINIEIQNRKLGNWRDRAMFYACRNFSGLVTGEDYSKLKPYYQIWIIDFPMNTPYPEFYKRFEMCNLKHIDEKLNGKLSISVLSLKHIKQATDEDVSSGRLRWAKLFTATTWAEIKSLSTDNSDIREAAQTMYTVTSKGSVRKRLEAREKGIMDYNYGLSYSKDEGRAEGRVEGRAEGLTEGRAEGRAEERELNQQVFRMVIKENKSPEEVASALNVTVEYVTELLGL